MGAAHISAVQPQLFHTETNRAAYVQKGTGTRVSMPDLQEHLESLCNNQHMYVMEP